MFKKILVFILVLIFPYVAGAQFVDVSGDAFFAQRVEQLYERNILHGYEDFTLRPGQEISRAEFVKLVSALKKTRILSIEKKCFNDISTGDWFYATMCTAYKNGWIQGYPDKTVKAKQTIRLPEALKILFKAYQISFDEGGKPWFQDLIAKTQQLGLLPMTIGSFNQTLNREDAINLIFWFDSLENKNSPLVSTLERIKSCQSPELDLKYPHLFMSAYYKPEMLYLLRISTDQETVLPATLRLGQDWQKDIVVDHKAPTVICLFIDKPGGQQQCEFATAEYLGDFENKVMSFYLPGPDLQSFYSQCTWKIELEAQNILPFSIEVENRLLDSCKLVNEQRGNPN